MMKATDSADSMARQLCPSIGTFVKTASHQVIELLGGTGLDFAVIDAEHAPFDRLTIDLMMVAGRAAALPLFVRLPNGEASSILSALDVGAAGLLIPHVDTPEFAAAVVSRSKYLNGSRGFSRSPRSGGYGTRPSDAMIAEGDNCMIVCQIESEQGVSNVDDIARVAGVDALFIGRADLAMSMRVSATSPELNNAVQKIARSCHDAGKVLGMFVSAPSEFAAFSELGVSWCIMGSDQSLLRNGAQAGTSEFRSRYVSDRA